MQGGAIWAADGVTITISGTLLCCWMLVLPPVLLLRGAPPVPEWALAVYDVVLAGLGVLVRAFSSAKTGALPFWHACSRLKHGNVRKPARPTTR